MRAIWKGAVSFGLVNVPVRLYTATQDHDIRFHQVHREDGGRIRMKRTCTVCGEEVAYEDLAKGYEAPDGQLVMLTDEDMASLPVSAGHEIDVVEFVPADQVDPVLFDRSYYLEPDARAAKPYALLREALETTDRMALVRVALRQRETLAVLRVRDKAILMQTMIWPDEVRGADFEVLETEVDVRPQELAMATSLVESLAADFDPDQFEDEYRVAVTELIDRKLEGAMPVPTPLEEDGGGSGEVVDLLTALQRSVERARSGGSGSGSSGSGSVESAGATKTTPAKKAPAKTPAKKTASKTPAKKAASKTPAKKAASKTASKSAAKKPGTRRSA
jgi:DNA end-binding protein Ku